MRPVPVLDMRSGVANLDWPAASYAATVDVDGDDYWTVRHTLTGARQLEDLIAAGTAAWAVEVRCPRTLYSELFHAQSPRMEVAPRPGATQHPLWILPGIIATGNCTLGGGELNTIWHGGDIAVAAGTWLAHGLPVSRTAATSLLRFSGDENMSPGRMRISEDRDDNGHLRLLLEMHPAQIARINTDPWLVAMSWSAAVAHIATLPAFAIPPGEGTEPSERYGQLLVRQLRAEGIPLWDDPDWCPLTAATALVALPEPAEAPTLSR